MDYVITSKRAWAVVTVPLSLISRIGSAIGGVGALNPIGGIGVAASQTPVDITLDIGRYSIDWELNAIPNANLTIAVGRLASDVRQVSAIHRIVHQLKEMVPISIYIEDSTSNFAPASEIDAVYQDKAIRIFRGVVVSTGFRRHDNNLEFIISAAHWLRDLTFSSALSRSSHPSNPNQTSFNAAFPDLAVSGGIDIAPHATADTMPANFFSVDVVRKDFWGSGETPVDNTGGFKLGGMKEFLKQLSSVDRMYTTPTARQIFGQPNDVNNEKNWEALRALQHFEPNARYRLPGEDKETLESGYVDGVPLSMDLDGVDGITAIHVASAIGMTMGRETFSSIASQTLWDKLVGQYAPLFLFAIVPMVEKALIVPFTPGLKWNGGKKGARLITTQDYSGFEFVSQNISPLKGVFLLTSMAVTTGYDVGREDSPSYTLFGPKYVSQQAENSGGLVMFKSAPRWLTDLSIPFLYPSMSPPFSTAHDSVTDNINASLESDLSAIFLSNGIDDPNKTTLINAVKVMVEDGERDAAKIMLELVPLMNSLNITVSTGLALSLQIMIGAAVQSYATNIADVYSKVSGLWDRYAQALYVQEKTKGRQATLTGRFRLDIAPGTLVKIETNSPDLNIAPPVCPGSLCVDDKERYLYGTVLRISIWGDAQANKTGTSFQIGFIHDEYEEQSSDTTVDRHPVWATAWYGAPLVVDKDPATDKFRHWNTPVLAPNIVN